MTQPDTITPIDAGDRKTGVRMNDYLVLSLKWTKASPLMVWYAPKAQGYTSSITHAGRFTKEEAESHEFAGETLAVPLAMTEQYAVHAIAKDYQQRLMRDVSKSKEPATAEGGAK